MRLAVSLFCPRILLLLKLASQSFRLYQSRSLTSCSSAGATHPSRLHSSTSGDPANGRSILRFDSASSELGYLQIGQSGSLWSTASTIACSHPHSGPADLGFERRSWGSDGSGSSSTGAQELGDGPAGVLLAERWDSAQSETFSAVVVSQQQEPGLSEQQQLLLQQEQRRRLQQQWLAAVHCGRQPDAAQPLMEQQGPEGAGCSHQQGQLRNKSGAMPAAAEDVGDIIVETDAQHQWGGLRCAARTAAGPHMLATEDRVRQPRRRRSSAKPQPRARRCLSAAFAAAADAQRLQPLGEAPQMHSICPSLPGCCPTAGLPAATVGDPLPSTEGTWQPGGLWEVMSVAPMGLVDEAARSVVANVAYGLQCMHEDSLVHRHVSICTVVLGEHPCFDTARQGPYTSSTHVGTPSITLLCCFCILRSLLALVLNYYR